CRNASVDRCRMPATFADTGLVAGEKGKPHLEADGEGTHQIGAGALHLLALGQQNGDKYRTGMAVEGDVIVIQNGDGDRVHRRHMGGRPTGSNQPSPGTAAATIIQRGVNPLNEGIGGSGQTGGNTVRNG